MPSYLSDEWLAALDTALGASAVLAQLAPLVIDQVVSEVPGRGEVRYRVWFDDQGGHACVPAARDEPGDVSFRTDYATAMAIARGDENAQTALAAGRLHLGGELEALTRHGDALAALDDAAAGVRAATTYADDAP